MWERQAHRAAQARQAVQARVDWRGRLGRQPQVAQPAEAEARRAVEEQEARQAARAKEEQGEDRRTERTASRAREW